VTIGSEVVVNESIYARNIIEPQAVHIYAEQPEFKDTVQMQPSQLADN